MDVILNGKSFYEFPHTQLQVCIYIHVHIYVYKEETRDQTEEHVRTNKEDVQTSNIPDVSFAFSIQPHFTKKKNSSRTYIQVTYNLSGLCDVNRGVDKDAALF